MTIYFCGTRDFGDVKQEKIAELISARVDLLISKKYSSHIDSISFHTDLNDWKKNETNFWVDGQALIELNTLNKRPVSICIHLSEELLLNTLIPGSGQSRFDELFLRIRNVLCQSIN